MLYQQGQFYVFPVRGGADEEVLYLEAEGPDGPGLVTLNKLDFQRNPRYKIPDRLECRVIDFDDNGLPQLGHSIASYVQELYQDTYRKGDTFECMVVGVPSSPTDDIYNIRDRNGIFFRIHEAAGTLTKGQKIRCKIKSLSGKHFEIKRIDDKSVLPFLHPSELLEGAGVTEITKRMAGLLYKSDEYEIVRQEIGLKKSQWPFTAATIIRDNLSEWFVAMQGRGYSDLLSTVLMDLKKVMLYLLEGSNFLNAVNSEQRRAYQQLLTEYVEGIEPYNVALRRLLENSEDDFVEGLFDKLQKSGYLYHPLKQFGVMMLVFRVYPEKVSGYLNRIFESIFMRDLDNWKREPFRSAFVEQFQIYVRQARREIDSLPVAEKKEQRLRLETIITALALEILLAPEENTDRTKSLFYRYISLLRPLNSEALLSKSFVSLLGAELPDRPEYSMLREPMMMMTQATVLPAGDILGRLQHSFRYSNGSVDFNISDSGLSLSRTDERTLMEQSMVNRTIPEGFMNWLRPQIYVNGVKNPSPTKMKSLHEHNLWWRELEKALFVNASVATEEPEVRKAVEGDYVWIVIDGIKDMNDNDPTFLCHIQDDNYESGKGFIKRSQIVSYNLRQPDIQSFKDEKGQPLGYWAKVTGMQRNGEYKFSLTDQVREFANSVLNYTDEYVAVVTGTANQGYSAISRGGFGLFLREELHPGRELTPGTVVHYRLTSNPGHGYIIGYITDTPTSEDDHFDKFEAFANLMHSIGIMGEDDELADEVAADDNYEYLSADNVHEIIEILRFHAISDSDLVKAFDYLQYARLLALMTGDTAMADKLMTHSELLEQHQYYANNTRIDAESLEELRSIAHNDPLLAQLFHRLEIVSWLGNEDRNEALFATASNPENELEGNLAKMVLSYNMMKAQTEDDDSVTNSLKTRIMSMLKLNNATKSGTYYGNESKYVEFKTSLVCVATAKGEQIKENPGEQQAHILSRIAGMLNGSGGTLYLGVNNEGYAVGLHDDFKYYERHKMHVGKLTFDIRNVDNLCVYLENLVNRTFGETTARKIEIGVDDKADKDVIVISIKESLTPVFIDGHLFVRQSGQSTYEYTGQVKEDFIAEREQQRLEKIHMAAVARAEAEASTRKEEKQEAASAEIQPETPNESIPEPEPAVQESGSSLSTSRWRPNVLHNYQDDYNEPEGYLYFVGETGIKYNTQDLYMEDDPDTRLVLAIPHELKDGYLILGFADQRALRVPLTEIYEKGDNSLSNHNGDYPLLFAAIAGKDDMLLVMAADSSNSVWRRAFSLNQIEAGHISGVPKKLTDSVISRTVGWDIIDASAKENFAGCNSEKMSGKRFGEIMRIKADDPRWPEKLREETDRCHII